MTLNDFWTMCPMGQRVCYTDFQICDPIDFGKCGPCVFGAGWQDPGEPTSPPIPRHPAGLLEQFGSYFHEARLLDARACSRGGRERCSGPRERRLGSLSRRFRGTAHTNGETPPVAQPVHRPLRAK